VRFPVACPVLTSRLVEVRLLDLTVVWFAGAVRAFAATLFRASPMFLITPERALWEMPVGQFVHAPEQPLVPQPNVHEYCPLEPHVFSQ